MNNGKRPPDFGQAKPPGGRVTGLQATMAVMCNCGSQTPVLVPFLSAGPTQMSCGECGTTFVVAKIDFDIKRPAEVRFAVGSMAPVIVRPPSDLVVS